MLWFFVLTFITWDGLETQHLEGPYPTEAACAAAIQHVGATIPEWVKKAMVTPCTRARRAAHAEAWHRHP